MLVQSTLSNTIARTRPELPGCVMLAAIPHRRLPGESPVRAVGVAEAVCPNTVTTAGFTLIELSIVLVIIGLIVGGVLVGRDLIRAAEVRAQITQIEKYQQAVNTFRVKYGYLPGDIPQINAAQFGLGFHVAEGCFVVAGNGLIEGYGNSDCGYYGQGIAETGEFWLDLSSPVAGPLIGDGNFSGINGNCGADIIASNAASCFPAAKLGNGNYVYAYTNEINNWYGIGNIGGSDPGNNIPPQFAAFTVAQAYAIDKKVDDGLPGVGNVIAGSASAATGVQIIANHSYAAGPASCFDNGGVSTAQLTYSLSQNNGAGVNCQMSLKFQ